MPSATARRGPVGIVCHGVMAIYFFKLILMRTWRVEGDTLLERACCRTDPMSDPKYLKSGWRELLRCFRPRFRCHARHVLRHVTHWRRRFPKRTTFSAQQADFSCILFIHEIFHQKTLSCGSLLVFFSLSINQINCTYSHVQRIRKHFDPAC